VVCAAGLMRMLRVFRRRILAVSVVGMAVYRKATFAGVGRNMQMTIAPFFIESRHGRKIRLVKGGIGNIACRRLIGKCISVGSPSPPYETAAVPFQLKRCFG